jgi:ABC-type Zn uptake system ZnuABC Zn-binding protein ZnuA
VRRRAAFAAAGAAFLAVALTGCAAGAGSTGRPVVVATTTQIGDWARQIGGSDVTVHQILQPNTDPHEYEPRPKDVEATASAKLVLENGDGLDHWMAKVVSQAGGRPRVVVLGDHVPVRLPGESSGPEASRYDPHWWHDPRDAEAGVVAIRGALGRVDPDRKAVFKRRAAAYLKRLRALDDEIARCLQRVAPSRRKLVTDHDAFNYFAHRYGITVVGAVIPSQTTQAQPSAGELARLIALIRREHVAAVFPESSLSPRLAETIARETGASSHYTLYGDTLGPAGSAGATYVRMEAANADAIVRGLTGGTAQCRITG